MADALKRPPKRPRAVARPQAAGPQAGSCHPGRDRPGAGRHSGRTAARKRQHSGRRANHGRHDRAGRHAGRRAGDHAAAGVLRALQGSGQRFFERGSSAAATIESLIRYATKARKNGIVSLEKEAAAIADPFLRKALNLAVDGTDLQELRKMMELDIALSEQAARGGSQGLGGGRRICAHHRDHRGGDGADPGDEDIWKISRRWATVSRWPSWPRYTEWGRPIFSFCRWPTSCSARIAAATLRQGSDAGRGGGHRGRAEPQLIRMKLEAYNQDSRKPQAKAAQGAAAKPARRPRQPAAGEVEPAMHATQTDEPSPRKPRTLAGLLCRFHHPAVRLLRGDVRLHASDKSKAKAVSESVRRLWSTGNSAAAVSTVLGRGKHENSKPPRQSRAGETIGEPAAAAPPPRRRPIWPIAGHAAARPGRGTEGRQDRAEAGGPRPGDQPAGSHFFRFGRRCRAARQPPDSGQDRRRNPGFRQPGAAGGPHRFACPSTTRAFAAIGSCRRLAASP